MECYEECGQVSGQGSFCGQSCRRSIVALLFSEALPTLPTTILCSRERHPNMVMAVRIWSNICLSDLNMKFYTCPRCSLSSINFSRENEEMSNLCQFIPWPLPPTAAAVCLQWPLQLAPAGHCMPAHLCSSDLINTAAGTTWCQHPLGNAATHHECTQNW